MDLDYYIWHSTVDERDATDLHYYEKSPLPDRLLPQPYEVPRADAMPALALQSSADFPSAIDAGADCDFIFVDGIEQSDDYRTQFAERGMYADEPIEIGQMVDRRRDDGGRSTILVDSDFEWDRNTSTLPLSALDAVGFHYFFLRVTRLPRGEIMRRRRDHREYCRERIAQMLR